MSVLLDTLDAIGGVLGTVALVALIYGGAWLAWNWRPGRQRRPEPAPAQPEPEQRSVTILGAAREPVDGVERGWC